MTVSVRNLSKSYGGKAVLKDFSADFGAGFTLITGVSGSGKTTLLNVLMGLSAPDAGSVEGLEHKRVVAVFQDNRLLENLGAVKNVALVCGKETKTDAIVALLSRLGLSGSLSKPVSSFSGGMKKRVAIARALIRPADLYLFDEPFNGLDERLKADVAAVIREYVGNAAAVVVTHSPAEAELLGAAHVVAVGT